MGWPKKATKKLSNDYSIMQKIASFSIAFDIPMFTKQLPVFEPPPILQLAQSDERAGRREMMILTKCSSEISVRQSQESRQEQYFTSIHSIASHYPAPSEGGPMRNNEMIKFC